MKNVGSGRAGLAMTARILLALGLVVAIGGGPTEAQAQECEDVSGDWSVTIAFPGNVQAVTVTLEQTDCALAGMVKGNNETAIEGGAVEGSTFTFSTTVNANGQAVTLAWEGTVEGDDVAGTLSSDLVGVVEFTGKRVE